MLHHSFSHIPSVGAATERKIWDSGVYSMDDFVKSPPDFLSMNKSIKIAGHIQLSKEKIANKGLCIIPGDIIWCK